MARRVARQCQGEQRLIAEQIIAHEICVRSVRGELRRALQETHSPGQHRRPPPPLQSDPKRSETTARAHRLPSRTRAEHWNIGKIEHARDMVRVKVRQHDGADLSRLYAQFAKL